MDQRRYWTAGLPGPRGPGNHLEKPRPSWVSVPGKPGATRTYGRTRSQGFTGEKGAPGVPEAEWTERKRCVLLAAQVRGLPGPQGPTGPPGPPGVGEKR